MIYWLFFFINFTESESTDEADNHIYSSIVDGKSSSNQSSKSETSESSDQYGEITAIDGEKDENDERDRVSVALEAWMTLIWKRNLDNLIK